MKFKKWSLAEKLEILGKSEELGIVEACRKYSVSTGTFYSWKSKLLKLFHSGLTFPPLTLLAAPHPYRPSSSRVTLKNLAIFSRAFKEISRCPLYILL
jgi:hypothetical protein